LILVPDGDHPSAAERGAESLANLRNLRSQRSGLRWLAIGLLAVACRSGGAPATGSGAPTGTFELAWSDSTGRAHLTFPANGRWCAADSLLEIMASRRDSALGLVLLAGDSSLAGLGTGTYSAMPAKVFIPWRPRAIAALRLAGTESVAQYESTRGQVTLTRAGPDGLAGQVDLYLVASAGTDSLHLTGSFQGIRPVPVGRPCGRLDKPPPG
jgi:hypothetical protein